MSDELEPWGSSVEEATTEIDISNKFYKALAIWGSSESLPKRGGKGKRLTHKDYAKKISSIIDSHNFKKLTDKFSSNKYFYMDDLPPLIQQLVIMGDNYFGSEIERLLVFRENLSKFNGKPIKTLEEFDQLSTEDKNTFIGGQIEKFSEEFDIGDIKRMHDKKKDPLVVWSDLSERFKLILDKEMARLRKGSKGGDRLEDAVGAEGSVLVRGSSPVISPPSTPVPDSHKSNKPGLFGPASSQKLHPKATSKSGYKKKKQTKISMKSALDDIQGVGEQKKKILLRHFGSMEQLARAGFQDLLNVEGVGKKTAKLIYNNLH